MSPEVFTQLEARIEGLGVDFRVDDGGVSRVLLLGQAVLHASAVAISKINADRAKVFTISSNRTRLN